MPEEGTEFTVYRMVPTTYKAEKQEDGSILWALPLADVTTGFDFKGEFEAPKPPPAPEEKSGGVPLVMTGVILTLFVLVGGIVILSVVMIAKSKKPKIATGPATSENPAAGEPQSDTDTRDSNH